MQFFFFLKEDIQNVTSKMITKTIKKKKSFLAFIVLGKVETLMQVSVWVFKLDQINPIMFRLVQLL